MQGFWRLTSILMGLMGFTATAIVLLMKGENLPNMVIKAIVVFAVVYIVQNYLGGLFLSVVGSGSQSASDSQGPGNEPSSADGA